MSLVYIGKGVICVILWLYKIWLCTFFQLGCKVALIFSNYGILANYSWLLVEGHYLHSLIHLSLHSPRKRLHWYISFGWGTSHSRFLLSLYSIFLIYTQKIYSQQQNYWQSSKDWTKIHSFIVSKCFMGMKQEYTLDGTFTPRGHLLELIHLFTWF